MTLSPESTCSKGSFLNRCLKEHVITLAISSSCTSVLPSKAAIALADLLPAIDVVKDDPYNSSLIDPDLQSKEVLEKIVQGESLEKDKKQVPMVDLPLGATEDRPVSYTHLRAHET